MNNLALYDDEIVEKIEQLAEANDGVLSEEDVRKLVSVHMADIDRKNQGDLERAGKLVNAISAMEYAVQIHKLEEKRVLGKRKSLQKKIDNIKKFITPYIKESGKLYIGTHTLSIRTSQGVVLDDGFKNPMYCEEVVTLNPDKKKIKADLKSDIAIEGAKLESRDNLQIK